jgi:hypothetical protein
MDLQEIIYSFLNEIRVTDSIYMASKAWMVKLFHNHRNCPQRLSGSSRNHLFAFERNKSFEFPMCGDKIFGIEKNDT